MHNIKPFKKYLLLLIVLTLSFLGATFLPISEVFKGIISLPGGGALIYVLYQLIRDDQQHTRNLLLQDRQQDFILGTASHMADVAYDKHAEFCEEYINRVQQGFQELLRDGPSRRAIKIGGDLVRIRQKHSPWLTQDIEKKLKPFELALIKIGAKEGYLENAKLPIGKERSKVINEVYKLFGLVLGHEKPVDKEEAGIYIDKIIEEIRNMLGVNILTELRLKTAQLALKRIK